MLAPVAEVHVKGMISKKMWYEYTKEYYPAIKKNELMPFAKTWTDLEMINLSEVSQTKTNPLTLLVGMQTGTATMENSVEIS